MKRKGEGRAGHWQAGRQAGITSSGLFLYISSISKCIVILSLNISWGGGGTLRT